MAVFRPIATRWAFGVAGERQGPEARADDRPLVERAQRGDPDAFAELMRRHQRRVFSLIANLVRQPAEVEDIAQQVFLKVYLALPRFDFRAAFSTWLYRVVVNECYDHIRRQRAQKAPGGSEFAVEDLTALEQTGAVAHRPTTPDVARRTEARQLLEQLFRRLSPEDRLLLTLKELEGFSVEETAEILKLKENTVKVRLFRARRKLLEIHRRFLAGRRSGERGSR